MILTLYLVNKPSACSVGKDRIDVKNNKTEII